MKSANDKQVGGTHYQQPIQPWDYVAANKLGYFEGTAIKYISRWRQKNGIEDLRKAIHFLEKLIEVEQRGSTHSLEPLANLSRIDAQQSVNGTVDRFLHVHDVGEQVGHSHPIWPGELNNIPIIRNDV